MAIGAPVVAERTVIVLVWSRRSRVVTSRWPSSARCVEPYERASRVTVPSGATRTIREWLASSSPATTTYDDPDFPTYQR